MAYRVERIDVRADRKRLFDFWDRHGNKSLAGKYEWIYTGNPDGDASAWLLVDDDGEVVGSQVFFPRRFVCNGEEIRGGVIGDFLVAPGHRTLAPAVKLNRATKGILEKEADLILSFPNAKARPVQLRVGFKQAAPLERLAIAVGSKQLMQRRGVPPLLARVAAPIVDAVLACCHPRSRAAGIDHCDRVPGGVENLWRKICAGLSLYGERDERRLTWKYDQDIDDTHRWITFSEGGRMRAAAVYRTGNHTLELREFLFDEDDLEAGRAILAEAIRTTRALGLSSLVVTLAATNPLAQTLRALGLRVRRNDDVLLACCAKGKEELLEHMKTAGRSYIMASDQDT